MISSARLSAVRAFDALPDQFIDVAVQAIAHTFGSMTAKCGRRGPNASGGDGAAFPHRHFSIDIGVPVEVLGKYPTRREGHRPVTPTDGAGAVLADESQSLLSASGLGIDPSGA
jgi:hypothetical protein